MEAVFTAEMKTTHTIIIPEMLEYHFPILKAALMRDGYKAAILHNKGAGVINCGKKFVNNDMCFPATAIIGQIIDALKNGLCDPNKTAFLLPQAGGACRAPNYFHLLRKALSDAGYPHIPIISLNLSGLNSQPGFKISFRMIKSAVISVLFGDLLMHLYQQVRPRASSSSEADSILLKWQEKLCKDISSGKICRKSQIKPLYRQILHDFSEIKLNDTSVTKIGIVGELYIKYCKIGNLDAEEFLYSQGCEIRTTGFAIYAFYIIQSILYDTKSGYALKKAAYILLKRLNAFYAELCGEVRNYGFFDPIPEYGKFYEKSGEIISKECVTGDGWLISAEAAVLIEHGFDRIICLNPFGCLVSHVNCKGISGAIRRKYPHASVTNIDCDSDTSSALFHSRLLMAIGK